LPIALGWNSLSFPSSHFSCDGYRRQCLANPQDHASNRNISWNSSTVGDPGEVCGLWVFQSPSDNHITRICSEPICSDVHLLARTTRSGRGIMGVFPKIPRPGISQSTLDVPPLIQWPSLWDQMVHAKRIYISWMQLIQPCDSAHFHSGFQLVP